jgi:hypothetical protein
MQYQQCTANPSLLFVVLRVLIYDAKGLIYVDLRVSTFELAQLLISQQAVERAIDVEKGLVS